MESPPTPSLSSRLRVSLAIARGGAAARGDTDLTPVHIALGLLREGENPAVGVLLHAGVNTSKLRSELEQALGPPGIPRPGEVCIGPTPGEQAILDASAVISRSRGDAYLGPHHVLLALLDDKGSLVADLFARHGIDNLTAPPHLDAIFAPHTH
jgi:ATP-dependent Clp protease ATP-binding subunit ClpB